MSSKIEGVDARPSPVGAGRPVNRSHDSATGDARGGGAGSGVNITDSARRLAALEQAVRDMPAVDDARVAEVHRALADGSYEVHAERIASKLLDLEQLLAHGRRGGK